MVDSVRHWWSGDRRDFDAEVNPPDLSDIELATRLGACTALRRALIPPVPRRLPGVEEDRRGYCGDI